MFFIGIFGVQSKSESIRTEQGVICPVCGAYDRFEVLRTFNYFHIFFIPVWRWNKRYYIKTRCCRRVGELDPAVGERIERGEQVEITREQLVSQQSSGECPACGAALSSSFNFCPRCGTRL